MKVETPDDEFREQAIMAMLNDCNHRHRTRACVCAEMQKKFEARWDELVAASSKLGERDIQLNEKIDDVMHLTGKLKGCESRLDERQKLLDDYRAKNDELRNKLASAGSRLEHYRLALEGIVRTGSDNYGIISEAAKAADFALNAPAHDHLVASLTEPLPAERDIRDNVELMANKPFVVEIGRTIDSEARKD